MLILATVLFCIPGNQLPDDDWLGDISADKLVHIALFAILVTLWGLPSIHRVQKQPESLKRTLILIVVVALIYGVAIELIQGAYIPNRSYSLADMAADALGSIAGGIFVNRQRLRNR